MRFIFFAILCFMIVANGYSQNFNISGKVHNTDNQPIKNANVVIKDSQKGVYTNKDGVYSINVKLGDTLIVSYLGMQTVEFIIKKEVAIVDIELLPKEELLDAVLIKKRKALSRKELLAQYPQNKKLIKTSLGIVDKDRASFSIQILDGKNLIPVGIDFLESLKNFFPTMRVIRDDDTELGVPRVYLFNVSYNYQPTAIFDVDGIIYDKAPTFINVDDIDRVALLRNGAAGRYGSAGAGGVIIINTKSSNIVANHNTDKIYDNSNLRDSLYKAVNAPVIYTTYLPAYLQNLLKQKLSLEL